MLLTSANRPGYRRCTTCGRAACWSPPWSPLTPASPERKPRCRRTAGTPVARYCGSGGIWRCRRGRPGGRCRAASASPTAPMSGWQPRPRCEELKGHLAGRGLEVKGYPKKMLSLKYLWVTRTGCRNKLPVRYVSPTKQRRQKCLKILTCFTGEGCLVLSN